MNSSRLQNLTSLADYLNQKGWTVSCAESCTGGGLAHAFTSLSGSSAWFEKSWVTYSNLAKQDCVDVSAQTLKQFGAVSSQTVEEMALGAQKNAGAEIAISISGIAESNNRVSSLMRRLDASDWLENPNLTGVTAAPQYGDQANRFQLSVKVQLPKSDQEGG